MRSVLHKRQAVLSSTPESGRHLLLLKGEGLGESASSFGRNGLCPVFKSVVLHVDVTLEDSDCCFRFLSSVTVLWIHHFSVSG
ncbi:hypothetical protein E5288_WYG011382 [Bos mutus]|uniref:Uncharacterized protein n=1 Tax=Bos mutus TaxID=72004 RepID=A0A6B0R9S5_9CETA|nr:hypothetical protein [Bos mutus]